jgi:5-dehydro-2-deoxygluconokinase
MTLEVLTMGRVSVDLYPEQTGVPLAEVRTFRKLLGGSATNVAVAAARLGRATAVVTGVGDDPFGVYVRRALTEFGVDASYVETHPTLRTPLVFCELFPPDRFPLLFYREPTAPDLQLESFPPEVREVPLFWVTGTGLSEEPSRSTTLRALRERSGRAHTVFDLDYRPTLWRDDPAPWYAEAAAHATVVVGNVEEWELVGELPSSVELTVAKLGPRGVHGTRRGEVVVVPSVEVEVVNGLGAGDAFGGALCHGLLAGWDLERTLAFANGAGALVASRLGCADDMPTADEVEELLCRA